MHTAHTESQHVKSPMTHEIQLLISDILGSHGGEYEL
jgi:hypothetical protein